MNKDKKNFTILLHQNGNIYFLSVVFICFFFFSCKEVPKRLDCKEIIGLKISYLPKDINTYIPVKIPEEIVMYEQSQYVKIIDKDFICPLVERINTLEESYDNISPDYRFICYIYIQDNSIPQKLYLGKENLILYNDKLMKYDKDLFDLFENRLY